MLLVKERLQRKLASQLAVREGEGEVTSTELQWPRLGYSPSQLTLSTSAIATKATYLEWI